MLLTVVVPCYNEELTILETHRRLVAATEPTGMECEFVYVDDGSRDGTAAILRTLSQEDPRVRFIRFARNFGHQIAITAGMDASAGDAVIVIDADLQDPPELIPRMLELWREGNEVVYGVRTARQGETRFKRYTAAAFYRLLNKLSDVAIPLDAGDFRLIDGRVVEILRQMPERSRFVRGLVSWVGFRQAPLHYERAPRFAGNTNYPFGRMLRLALDGMTAFSIAPLRLATWLGLTASFMAMMGIVYAIAARIFTRAWVPGWAGIFVAVLFMGGVQLLAIGTIGEYVGRIYGESKLRPLYIIAEGGGAGRTRGNHSQEAGRANRSLPQE